MKKNLIKIVFSVLVVTGLITALTLCAIAATSNLCPLGADRNDPDFIPSGYSDVDENDGWVMITDSEKNNNVKIYELENGKQGFRRRYKTCFKYKQHRYR